METYIDPLYMGDEEYFGEDHPNYWDDCHGV